MSQQKVHLRVMQKDDLPTVFRLVESVGWNQTEQDLKLFLEGGNNIYLAAEIEKQVVGMVASIDYGKEVAWISMMIVAEVFRGLGIGKLLLNTLIRQLKQRKYQTIKLDATPAGRPVYQKLGFREEYEIHRLVHPHWAGLAQKPSSGSARAITEKDLQKVIPMDRTIFGADRTVLINRLNTEETGYVRVRDNQIAAYAFGRQGRRFYQIGPVGGRYFEDIQSLLLLALKKRTGQAVVLDVPIDKAPLINWLNELGFVVQRPFYRMYLEVNNSPGISSGQYGIAGPEFG